MTDIDLDKLEAPTDAQIDHAIRQTEYKYFGDYEFSEEQSLAVETLVRAASALSAARASAREAAAEIEGLKVILQRIANSPITEDNPHWWRWAEEVKRVARAAQMDGEGA
ncbi:MAG: hypothetical protein ACRED4_01175 [Brevundimonas sp.]